MLIPRTSLFYLAFVLLFLSFPSSVLSSSKKWELFYTEGDIKLYRAPENQSGIIPFKAETTYPYSFEKVLKILTHYKGKPEWSPKLKTVKLHETIDPNTFIFSEYYRTPWPATDREFLLLGEVRYKGPKRVDLLARSVKNKNYAHAEHIQCDVSYLNFSINGLSDQKTRVVFEFLGDMKGWMPVWLINIIQKKWPLRFLQSLDQELKKKAPVSEIYQNLKRPTSDTNAQ